MSSQGQHGSKNFLLFVLQTGLALCLCLPGAGSATSARQPSPELFSLWEQIYNEPAQTLATVRTQLAALPANQDSETAAILYAIGAEAASFAEKTADHLQLALAAEAIAAQHRYYWPWVHAISTLAAYYEYDGDEVKSIKYYQQAVDLAEESQDPELLGFALNNFGYFHGRNGYTKDAIEIVGRAIRSLENLPKGVLYHDVINNLAVIYTRNELVGRMEEGRKLLEQSFAYFKSRQMRYMTGNNYINLGVFYEYNREYQTSIDTYKEAIKNSRALANDELLPYYLHRLAIVYNRSKQYHEALQANDEACRMFRQFKNNALLADCLLSSSLSLVKLNRPREALTALNERSQLLKVTEGLPESEEALEVEIKAWQQLGDVQKELQSYRRWGSALKKNYDQKNAQSTQQIAGLLELERKEADNRLLEAQNRTNILKLEQADRMGRILMGLLILSALLLGFMFFTVRQSRVIRLQRNRMQEVLDNIEEGILRFDKDFRVEAEFSAHLALILDIQKDATGQDLFQILFHKTDLTEDSQATIRAALANILGEGELGWSLNGNQLPGELHRQGRILNLLWQPHYNHQGQIDKMLLVIRDVTSSKALEAEVQASRQQFATMTQFVQEMLQANTRSLEHFIVELEEQLPLLQNAMQRPQEQITALRQLHTMKGNARSLGLVTLAEAVHQLESAHKRQQSLTQDLAHLQAVCQQYAKLFHAMFRSHLAPASSLLAIVDEICPGLFQQLALGHARFGSITVRDEVGLWPADLQGPLRVLLLHSLSNAVDHGYLLQPGSEAVTLKVDASRLTEGIRITIRDRGCGLRWDKLKSLALQRGFTPAANRPLSDLLFMDGVSTKETVSLSSGRGVGLAAVKEACQELGAEVTLLDNDEGQGTMLVVDIPSRVTALSA